MGVQNEAGGEGKGFNKKLTGLIKIQPMLWAVDSCDLLFLILPFGMSVMLIFHTH